MGIKVSQWREPGTLRVDLGEGAHFAHKHLSKGERDEWFAMLAWVDEQSQAGREQAEVDAEFSDRFASWLGGIVESVAGVVDDDGNELGVGEWARAMVAEAPSMAGFVARSIVSESGVTEQQGNN